MDCTNELLIRVYDVGFGDCIFICVPDKVVDQATGQTRLEHRHILIDCGTVAKKDEDEEKPSSSFDPIRMALSDMKKHLPKVDGERQLDLLVVTHPHRDHFSGFSESRMKGIHSRHIWMSVFMDPTHDQAPKSFAFEEMAFRATLSLVRQGLRLGPGLLGYLQAKKGNEKYVTMLSETLPKKSEPGEPLYIARDKAQRMTAAERAKHRVHFDNNTTCFQDFQEQGTCLRVLAPEWDIDNFYLSPEAKDMLSLLDRYPATDDYDALLSMAEEAATGPGDTGQEEPEPQPTNISPCDFRALRNRLQYSAMRFQQNDDHLKNDVSVVLLLEWRGHKLLFTGDAEWQGGYEQGGHNGSWDVLWMQDQAGPKHLSEIDFLKVGHHGSVNGSPWTKGDAQHIVLESMLPEARKNKAKIVVSTCRTGNWPSVPCTDLVKEDGVLDRRGTVRLTNRESDLDPGKNYIDTTYG